MHMFTIVFTVSPSNSPGTFSAKYLFDHNYSRDYGAPPPAKRKDFFNSITCSKN